MSKKSYMFYPTQPELKSNCISYVEYKPYECLKSEVALYYQFKTDRKPSVSLPVIPDGCIDILISCQPSQPLALIATSPEQRCSYTFEPDTEFFAVRLSPEQSSLKFKCSIKELLQYQQISLFEVLDLEHSFPEKMAIQSSFNERISLFNSLLIPGQQTNSYDQNIVTYCLKLIYSTKGLLNIKDLAEETGYSDRYIRKKFNEYVGFSPKHFSQIVRLQHSIENLVSKGSNLNETINDYSFYDPAHYYKDFKKYMKLTPAQYVNLLTV